MVRRENFLKMHGRPNEATVGKRLRLILFDTCYISSLKYTVIKVNMNDVIFLYLGKDTVDLIDSPVINNPTIYQRGGGKFSDRAPALFECHGPAICGLSMVRYIHAAAPSPLRVTALQFVVVPFTNWRRPASATAADTEIVPQTDWPDQRSDADVARIFRRQLVRACVV